MEEERQGPTSLLVSLDEGYVPQLRVMLTSVYLNDPFRDHELHLLHRSLSAVNGSTGSGYETIGGEIQRNRPIYNISGYDLEPGIYKVTWNSDSGGPMYNHYGELHISYIDYDHPNHS